MDTLISFMIQDMKNVCIYLPQALAAGAVYVLVYVLFRRFGRHCNFSRNLGGYGPCAFFCD